jgi:hypothetical protein
MEQQNQEEVTKVMVEVDLNEGFESKVSESTPIHICGKAAKGTKCVFALCGNCFLPPETRRSAGRERRRGVATGDRYDCNGN